MLKLLEIDKLILIVGCVATKLYQTSCDEFGAQLGATDEIVAPLKVPAIKVHPSVGVTGTTVGIIVYRLD